MSMNEAELIKELEMVVNELISLKLDKTMVHNIHNSLYDRYINDKTGPRLGLTELKMNLNVIIGNILKEEEVASKPNSKLKVNKAENYQMIKKCLRVMEVIAKLQPDHKAYNTFNIMDNNPLNTPPPDQNVRQMTLALSSFSYIKSTSLYNEEKSIKTLIDECLVDNSKSSNLDKIRKLPVGTPESIKERNLIVKSLNILLKLTSLERAVIEHNWTSKNPNYRNPVNAKTVETNKQPTIIFSRTKAKLEQERKNTELTNKTTESQPKVPPTSA